MSRKKESLSDLKPHPALETPIVMSTPKRTNNAMFNTTYNNISIIMAIYQITIHIYQNII
jgi:hypothetical protein